VDNQQNTHLNFDFLKNFNIDIMFAASPRTKVNHFKYKSSKNKSIFYIIYGIYVEDKKEYLVNSSIIQKTILKNAKISFKELETDILLFTDKQKVLEHIYFFLNQFSKHDRIIKEEIMRFGPSPAIECLNYLSEWISWVYSTFSISKNEN
jgi:hypothetical protein